MSYMCYYHYLHIFSNYSKTRSVPSRNLKSPANDYRDSKFVSEQWIKDL